MKLVERLLLDVPDQGGQTVIQFSAAVDWSDTVDFEERLTRALMN